MSHRSCHLCYINNNCWALEFLYSISYRHGYFLHHIFLIRLFLLKIFLPKIYDIDV